jgi:hypothetical protein
MQRQEKETTVRTTETPATPATPGARATMVPDTTPTPTGTVVSEREKVQGPVTWEEMRTLMRREPMMVERTWRPTVGGLLSILAGSWNVLLGLAMTIGGSIFLSLIPTIGGVDLSGFVGAFGIYTGVFFIVIGAISIVGGAFAMQRRNWPWALAGSIVALFPTPLVLPFILGFFSLIFNVLGHREFWAKARGEII